MAYNYSNIKDIYIELKNYSYFHNPSATDKIDKRFIGRTALIEQIKRLLTSSETLGGSYLVTGFRGMGKTSLINKVIQELKPVSSLAIVRNRLLRILSFILILSLLLTSKKQIVSPESSSSSWILIIGWFVILKSIYVLFKRRQYYSILKSVIPQPPNRLILLLGIVNVLLLFSLIHIHLSDLTYVESLYHYFVVDKPWSLGLAGLILAIPFFTITLTENSRLRNNLGLAKPLSFFGQVRLFIRKLISAFLLQSEKYSKAYWFYFVQDLNIGLLSHFIFINSLISYISSNGYPPDFTTTFFANISLSLLIILLPKGYYGFRINRRFIKKSRQTDIRGILKAHQVKADISKYIISELLIYRFFLSNMARTSGGGLKKLFNYSNRIYIKISLGQEVLNDSDILGVVAKRIRQEYSHVNSFWWQFPIGLINRLFKFLVIFFIAINLYSLGINDFLLRNFLENTRYYDLFPSQHPSVTLNSYFDSYYSKYLFNSDINWWENLIAIVRLIDTQFISIYQNILLRQDLILGLNTPIFKSGLVLIPKVPDYIFLLFLTLVYAFVNKVVIKRPFGITTHRTIQSRLDDLIDRIESEVHSQKGREVNIINSMLRFFSTRKKVYPIANVREIEAELLDILEEMSTIPRVLNRIEFVLIFDELDKIEYNYKRSIDDKENESSTPMDDHDAILDFSRNRRRAIAIILANLKNFFTSAKAKFIFIAGREMYDAFLADTSDRNFFLGSIFHEVVYVPSFLSDVTWRQMSGLKTSLTTQTIRHH